MQHTYVLKFIISILHVQITDTHTYIAPYTPLHSQRNTAVSVKTEDFFTYLHVKTKHL